MLTIHDLSKRWNVSTKTIHRWRKLKMVPSPLQLGPSTIRWREEDIDAFDDYCQRRIDLREDGLDCEQAAAPSYSLPMSADVHSLAREQEATRHEQPPEDMQSDKEKLVARIKQLKAEAIALCTAAGKPIPDELISAEVKS